MRCRSIAQIGLFTINSRGGDAVEASPVEISYLKDDGVFPYDLILDRISHEVPFYRTDRVVHDQFARRRRRRSVAGGDLVSQRRRRLSLRLDPRPDQS